MALLQGITECLVRRDAIALERESPGILVFSTSMQLLYMNREAQELTKRLHETNVGNHEKGLLPFEVMSLCKDLVTLFRTRVHPKDWEQMQLTRVAGVAKCPVLLRGVRAARSWAGDILKPPSRVVGTRTDAAPVIWTRSL